MVPSGKSLTSAVQQPPMLLVMPVQEITYCVLDYTSVSAVDVD